MMKFAMTVLLLIVCSEAFGHIHLRCYNSERFGNKLIQVGDGERLVLEQEPDREAQLENKFGAAAGYRYEFDRRNRTIQVYTESGVVTRICSVRT